MQENYYHLLNTKMQPLIQKVPKCRLLQGYNQQAEPLKASLVLCCSTGLHPPWKPRLDWLHTAVLTFSIYSKILGWIWNYCANPVKAQRVNYDNQARHYKCSNCLNLASINRSYKSVYWSGFHHCSLQHNIVINNGVLPHRFLL